MLDQLIDSAEEQYRFPLRLKDAGLAGTDAPEAVREWCDSYARRLAERYLSGELNWMHADCAANRVFTLMVRHCGEHVPDYAWHVYLAFDEGELDGRGDEWTRERLLAVQKRFGLS